MGKGKVIITCGGIIGANMAAAFSDAGFDVQEWKEPSGVVKIYPPEPVPKIIVSEPTNNKFIQQKMQGKRRVY